MAEEYEIINDRVYDKYKRVGVLHSAINDHFWVNDNISNPVNDKSKMFSPDLVFYLWKHGNMNRFYTTDEEGQFAYTEEAQLMMNKLNLNRLFPLTLEWIPYGTIFRIGIKSVDSEMLSGSHKEFIEYYDPDEWCNNTIKHQ